MSIPSNDAMCEQIVKFLDSHVGSAFTASTLRSMLGVPDSLSDKFIQQLSRLKNGEKIKGFHDHSATHSNKFYSYSSVKTTENPLNKVATSKPSAKAIAKAADQVLHGKAATALTDPAPKSAPIVLPVLAPAPAPTVKSAALSFKRITDRHMPNFKETRAIYPFDEYLVGQGFEAGEFNPKLKQRLYAAINTRRKRHPTESWKIERTADNKLCVWRWA